MQKPKLEGARARSVCVPLIAALAVLGACDPVPRDEKGAPLMPKASSPAYVAIVERCPVAGKPPQGSPAESAVLAGIAAPLAAALASAATTYVVDVVTEAIDDWGNGFRASSVAAANGYLRIPPGPNSSAAMKWNRCLLFVRAPSTALTDRPIASDTTEEHLSEINDEILSANKNNALHLMDEPAQFLKERPEVYAEFLIQLEQVAVGKNTTPLRFGIRPVYVHYGKSGAARGGPEKKLVFDVVIKSPGKDGTMDVIHQSLFDLDWVKETPGQWRGDRDQGFLLGKTARLSPLPDMTNLVATSKTGGQETITRFGLIETSITLTETDPGKGDFERLFAKALADKKADISKAVVALSDEQVKRIFGVKDDKK